MKKLIILFLVFLYGVQLIGQVEISNLTFEKVLTKTKDDQQNNELIISFNIEDFNDIHFIYLGYALKRRKDEEATFRLFNLKEKKYTNINIEHNADLHDKVIIAEIIDTEYVEPIEFIRIYISNRNRMYSNTLLFEGQ
ncbi:MAG: hypothetical protein AAFO07_18925 [Bacteroidota bacterium]